MYLYLITKLKNGFVEVTRIDGTQMSFMVPHMLPGVDTNVEFSVSGVGTPGQQALAITLLIDAGVLPEVAELLYKAFDRDCLGHFRQGKFWVLHTIDILQWTISAMHQAMMQDLEKLVDDILTKRMREGGDPSVN